MAQIMVNLITNNLIILYRLKKAIFPSFSVFDRIFISIENHASLDQSQLTKYFFGCVLMKSLVARPCNAFCCYRP